MNKAPLSILDEYDERAPLAEAWTIPASWYTDDQLAQREQQAVFGRSWQIVGRTDQVAMPGQYLTATVAGEPIVVVRDAAGVLRAFFNVCRHHAAAVVTEACGFAKSFRCPYHGWNYALDATLKGAPEFNDVLQFDRASNGLVPVRVETWEQFVLITLDRQAPPLESFLGDLIPRLAPLQLRTLHFYARKSYLLDCNWKVYVDNYLDGGYHVPHLHKGLNSVLDYAEYTIENGENYCLQSSPMVVSSEDLSVAETRVGERAYYFWVYPNFMINYYEGVLDTNLVLPRGTGKTEVIFDFFFSEIGPEGEARNAKSVAVSETVQEEDVAICESVQRGLSSRAYKSGRLSVRREAGEHLFHRLLARQLRQQLPHV